MFTLYAGPSSGASGPFGNLFLVSVPVSDMSSLLADEAAVFGVFLSVVAATEEVDDVPPLLDFDDEEPDDDVIPPLLAESVDGGVIPMLLAGADGLVLVAHAAFGVATVDAAFDLFFHALFSVDPLAAGLPSVAVPAVLPACDDVGGFLYSPVPVPDDSWTVVLPRRPSRVRPVSALPVLLQPSAASLPSVDSWCDGVAPAPIVLSRRSVGSLSRRSVSYIL